MREAQRQRIERCLEEFDAWRASGVGLSAYVAQRGESIGHWRGRLSWEARWRQMLCASYTNTASQTDEAFVRAVPQSGAAKTRTNAMPSAAQRPECLRIVLRAPNSALHASVEWPLSQIAASSAWLREVLA